MTQGLLGTCAQPAVILDLDPPANAANWRDRRQAAGIAAGGRRAGLSLTDVDYVRRNRRTNYIGGVQALPIVLAIYRDPGAAWLDWIIWLLSPLAVITIEYSRTRRTRHTVACIIDNVPT